MFDIFGYSSLLFSIAAIEKRILEKQRLQKLGMDPSFCSRGSNRGKGVVLVIY